jgi:hypothetical protein
MTRKLVLMLALAGLVLICAPACSNDDGTSGPLRAAGTVTGLVLNVSTDEPVPGAQVKITSKPFVTDATGTGDIVTYTTTDIHGLFFREDVPNGEIVVEVKASGYVTPDPEEWALSPGGIGDFLFELAPGEDPPSSFEDDDNKSAWPPDYSGDSGGEG